MAVILMQAPKLNVRLPGVGMHAGAVEDSGQRYCLASGAMSVLGAGAYKKMGA